MGTPAGEIALIRQDLNQNKLAKAGNLATKFAKKYPDSELVEEAHYLGGQADIRRGHYWQAFNRLEKLLNGSPSGRFYERGLNLEYDVAEAFLQGKKKLIWGFIPLPAQDDGLEILQRIAERFPGSGLAERSLLRVADYHFNQREWQDAADAYIRYQTLFPNRDAAGYAEFRAAQSYYNDYRGSAFDDTPLLEARQRFEAYQARRPTEASRQGVGQTLTEIELAEAKKSFEVGEFYVRTDKPKSAAYYYRQTASRFPGTLYAQKSQAALARLGLPAAAPVAPAGGGGRSAPGGAAPTGSSRPAAGTNLEPLAPSRPAQGLRSQP